MRGVLLCLLFPFYAAASESASFLTLGAGARAAALSGAFTAAADDASAAYWNPAGLSRVSRPELLASHRESSIDFRQNMLGAVVPIRRGALAILGSYAGHEAIAGRDELGRPTGTYRADDMSAGVAAGARAPWARLAVGVAVKHIRSALSDASARSYAVDAGVQGGPWDLPVPGTALAGLCARNMGPGLRFLDERTPLPLAASAGLAYRLGRWTASADYVRRPHADVADEVAVGAELRAAAGFALRAGYGSAASRTDGMGWTAALRGFTGGFGLDRSGWGLDYAMAPMGALGHAQTFSLRVRFP